MENTRETLMVGIELSKDYTQVSYIAKNKEVESMSTTSEEQNFAIPTLLYKYEKKFMWVIGERAALKGSEEGGTLIDNLVDAVIQGENIEIEGSQYSAGELLELYMKELVKMIHRNISTDEITHVVISIPELSKNLMDCLLDIFKRFGLPEKQIKMIGHTESFIYYTMSQKRDIWMNNVVIFELNRYGFHMKELVVSNSRVPAIVTVDEKDFSNFVNLEMLNSANGITMADNAFYQLILEQFRSKVVSSVFLIGEGFRTDWPKISIQALCTNRRVFMGDNLVSKGAGFCALDAFSTRKLKNYVFNCIGRTKVYIGLMVSHGEREVEQIIAYAGVNWYEAGVKMECILDKVDYLRFSFTSPVTGQSEKLVMELKGLPKRPNKTTRISLEIQYHDDSNFDILVTDMGFGDFYPTSGKVFKESVEINNAKEGGMDERNHRL